MNFTLFSTSQIIIGHKRVLLLDTRYNKCYFSDKKYIEEYLNLINFRTIKINKKRSILYENLVKLNFGIIHKGDTIIPQVTNNQLFDLTLINNLIVEVSKINVDLLINSKKNLNSILLYNPFIIIHIKKNLPVEKVIDLLDYLINENEKKSIVYIDFEYLIYDDLVSFLVNRDHLIFLTVFSSIKSNYLINYKKNLPNATFLYDEIVLKSCGFIKDSYFSPNSSTYLESQHHNTCLNRKMSIDTEGNIKNCPSMTKSYGNIKDTWLFDIASKTYFQKVWHIKKDEITKCKDCEFRHICTDCRAYIENPEDKFSAPLKCGYNPYTCEWEEWSANPLKQKAIEYYGIQELVKK